MPNYNVHPKKKIQKQMYNNSSISASEANEKDAKDLGYTDENGNAIPDKPKIGNPLVQRNEPDDED